MHECNCENHTHEEVEEESFFSKGLFINIIGIVVLIISILIRNKIDENISIILYIASYFLIGYDILYIAISKLFKKDMFNENLLMVIATIGAFFIGEYVEGIAVLLFYKVGEFLQELALSNSKKKIKSLVDLRPDYANLKLNQSIEKVDPNIIKVDDIIVVKNGEKVPLDGVITYGSTDLDVSALTGESIPRSVVANDEVLSGSINIGSVIELKVTKTYESSTVSKIIELIENSISKKSETEKFIRRFARIYTPIVILLAILIAILFPFALNITLEDSIFRALTFLVVSCPCALVISVPLGFFVGIGTSSKNGILIKGSNYLDMLTNVKQFVFDKTGTLTNGKFEIKEIHSSKNLTNDEILEYIAICEKYSNHYIAKAVLNSYKKEIDESRIKNHEEIAGNGIKADIDSKQVLVGNFELMKSNNIEIEDINVIGTVIYLAIDGIYEGYISLSDNLKNNVESLEKELRKFNVNDIVMLTGDNKNIADEVAKKLNFNEVYSELLPNDKVNILQDLKKRLNKNEYQVFVGDGINDAPVLATSDIGISMGKGSDIAIETSDIVLMTDEPLKLIDALKIAKQTKLIVTQNIIFAITVKILFLVFSSIGMLTMWFAIFADVGVSLIAILNSMRIFKYKNVK